MCSQRSWAWPRCAAAGAGHLDQFVLRETGAQRVDEAPLAASLPSRRLCEGPKPLCCTGSMRPGWSCLVSLTSALTCVYREDVAGGHGQGQCCFGVAFEPCVEVVFFEDDRHPVV